MTRAPATREGQRGRSTDRRQDRAPRPTRRPDTRVLPSRSMNANRDFETPQDLHRQLHRRPLSDRHVPDGTASRTVGAREGRLLPRRALPQPDGGRRSLQQLLQPRLELRAESRPRPIPEKPVALAGWHRHGAQRCFVIPSLTAKTALAPWLPPQPGTTATEQRRLKPASGMSAVSPPLLYAPARVVSVTKRA
jgi:hypothetical protein